MGPLASRMEVLCIELLREANMKGAKEDEEVDKNRAKT